MQGFRRVRAAADQPPAPGLRRGWIHASPRHGATIEPPRPPAGAHCDRTLAKLDPPVRRALRMGVHGMAAASGVWVAARLARPRGRPERIGEAGGRRRRAHPPARHGSHDQGGEPYYIRELKRRLSVLAIVDARVGTASDACVTMEQGVDGVLMNTAIASAADPVTMARAMRLVTANAALNRTSGRPNPTVRQANRRTRSCPAHRGRC